MGTLVFQATLGGQINLTGTNTASTFTITVPALTGTMASLAAVTNNGVAYVNSSGQPTTGSAFVFDGTSVGIGTNLPSTKLQITVAPTSSADNGMRVTDGTRIIQTNVTGSAYSYIGIGASETMLYSTGNPLNIVSDGQPIKFIAGTAERMRIDTSGNLLVGAPSGSSRLLVVGSGATSATNNAIFLNSSSTNLFTVRNDGYTYAPYWYATTTASAANVNVDTNGGLLRSTSALKYKQDIRDLESIDISKFRPVRYKSKCNGDDQTKDHFGFIADEVDAAGVKELVSYGANGEVEGFQYDRMTTVLLKAIQEQQALIQSLTTRLTALEQK